MNNVDGQIDNLCLTDSDVMLVIQSAFEANDYYKQTLHVF